MSATAQVTYPSMPSKGIVKVGGPPGTPVASVPNFAAASAHDMTAYTSGTLVWVESVKRPYMLDLTSGATVDGAEVLAATASQGTARLLSVPYHHPHWRAQATWSVDPATGNDENDGATSPLRTLDEYVRRVGASRTLDAAQTVTLSLAGAVAGAPLRIGGPPTSTLVLQGARPLIAADAVALTLGVDPNGYFRLTGAGAFDFAPYVGKVLVCQGATGINGTQGDYEGFILAAPTLGDVIVDTLLLPNRAAAAPIDYQPTDFGTSFEIRDVTGFDGVDVELSGGIVVRMNDLALGSTSGARIAGNATASLVGCSIGAGTVLETSQLITQGCDLSNSDITITGGATVATIQGGQAEFVANSGATVALSYVPTIYGRNTSQSRILTTAGATVTVDYNGAMIYRGNAPIQASLGGAFYVTGPLFGAVLGVLRILQQLDKAGTIVWSQNTLADTMSNPGNLTMLTFTNGGAYAVPFDPNSGAFGGAGSIVPSIANLKAPFGPAGFGGFVTRLEIGARFYVGA